MDRREAGALFPKGSRMPAWWGDHKWKLEAWAENSEQGAAPQSCLAGNFIPEEPVGRLVVRPDDSPKLARRGSYTRRSGGNAPVRFAIQGCRASISQTSGEFFAATEVSSEAGGDVSGNSHAVEPLPGTVRRFRSFRAAGAYRDLARHQGPGLVSHAGRHARGPAVSQEKWFSLRSKRSGLAAQGTSPRIFHRPDYRHEQCRDYGGPVLDRECPAGDGAGCASTRSGSGRTAGVETLRGAARTLRRG